MMRLHEFSVGSGLDDIGIDRSLGQKGEIAEFFGFFLEDADKQVADDFAFRFGVGNAF